MLFCSGCGNGSCSLHASDPDNSSFQAAAIMGIDKHWGKSILAFSRQNGAIDARRRGSFRAQNYAVRMQMHWAIYHNYAPVTGPFFIFFFYCSIPQLAFDEPSPNGSLSLIPVSAS